MTARRYLVSGVVQGVGYRFYALRAARARGLSGWVRNLPDGRVEALAEGEGAALDAFGTELRRGPIGSAVDSVEESSAGAGPGSTGFDIRF